jgi:flagellar basal-body rod modification protein FlgD
MAVGNVQNTSALAQQASNATSTSKSALDKDAFMKLLVAQLKNQDPLNPADAKEFVTQLSQLTGVEQMTSMSDKLGALQTATTSLVANQASTLVGKNIEGDGKNLYLGGNSTDKANSSFRLTNGADDVTVTIRDGDANVVRTVKIAGTQSAGVQPFSWDGLNDRGERMEAGKYTMSVEAKLAGKAVGADALIAGTVSSVSYERGFPELIVGKASVALANVTKISN